MDSKATHRYAKTFFKLSLEKDNIDDVVKDMKSIARILRTTSGLRAFLSNPIVSNEMVNNLLLNKIKDGVNPLTMKFFNLLLKKNRVHLIPEIPRAFIAYYEAHKNILRATIKSVQKLSDDQILAITEKLKIKTGAKDIQIKNIVDPKLIAGIQVKIGDTIIDANIKNKLVQLKRKLAA